MKALFCFYGPNGLGGPITWIQRMLPLLQFHGIDPVAVPYHTTADDCEVVSCLRDASIAVRVIEAASLSPEAGVQRMLTVIEEEKPSIIVADHVLPALIAGAWARRYRVPTVMVLRSDDPWYHHLQETFLSGPAAFRVETVVAVSRELAHSAELHAPTGVDIMECPSSTIIPKQRAIFQNNRFHVVYAGRLDDHQKCVKAMVQQLIAVSKIEPCCSATLYGDGPLREEVKWMLHSEQPHRVEYGGRISPDDVCHQLQNAQALVLMSAYEGLSSAIQEAMACGLPILARYTASGTNGVLIEGFNALLLENDTDLRHAITHLAHTPNDWQRLSDGARSFAEKHFDINTAALRWAELLHRSANKQGWPADALVRENDGTTLYLDYLSSKHDLEVFEAAALIDNTRLWHDNVDYFTRNPLKSWNERCHILYRGMDVGALSTELASPLARLLAAEGEHITPRNDEVLYRIASLWQRAGESAKALTAFSALADKELSKEFSAGCYYHLAEITMAEGARKKALAFIHHCLALLPSHMAAKRLLHKIRTDH